MQTNAGALQDESCKGENKTQRCSPSVRKMKGPCSARCCCPARCHVRTLEVREELAQHKASGLFCLCECLKSFSKQTQLLWELLKYVKHRKFSVLA